MLVNDMTNMGLISSICKQFIQLSIKKNLIKKWAKEDMQMAHEKMLSVANHQGNAHGAHLILRKDGPSPAHLGTRSLGH